LKEEETVFGDMYDLLDQQFLRLSELEQKITYWLAIEREWTSLDNIRENMLNQASRGALFEAIDSLRRRFMIETSGNGSFSLQPVIMEFVTERFVEQIYKEIDAETISLFDSHALIEAEAKNYIRESQVRLILIPLAQRLLSSLGKAGLEKKLRNILSILHEMQPQKSGYAAGNVLNLLVHLKSDLRGYNFSHLTMRQAYLQHANLQEVNFTEAFFSKSVFTEAFGNILSVAWSPKGKLLAVGTASFEIRTWQVPSGTLLLTHHGHTDWVRSVAFNPDENMLASGSDDHTVRLWDVNTGRCLKVLQEHNSRVYSVAFSPDGSMLASGSEDQTVRLWEVSSGQCLKILQGHSDWIWSVAFSPDGNMLVSSSNDQTVRLWEVSTGQCLKILRGHTDRVRSVAFSPDGVICAKLT
jgi:Tol biopolymer transport system component